MSRSNGAYLHGEQTAERKVPTRRYSALMKATLTEHGAVLVDCPYCLIYWRSHNKVDVSRFTEAAGKKEVTVYCSKGHKLRFRTIDEWRAQRIRMGVQTA